ncbi:Hypothetical predicted protein [Olea europaea subsp. europaea]|uniref:Uncharacterized protein n=1 Tax=Olea europaea subsp. europaea TaxID=158383 RepID=A0A8S0VA06_OLEEU|nr:Hypothetical predicted protein [Olea europaea subsp. europaea]
MPYDDLSVPTVVETQFNTSHAGSGSGDQLAREDSDDGISSEESADDETSGDDDGDRQSGSDRDGDDTQDSGEGASKRSSDGEDTRRGQTGASSTPRAPHVSLQYEGRRWKHGQLEHLDQASPEGRWKSCC